MKFFIALLVFWCTLSFASETINPVHVPKASTLKVPDRAKEKLPEFVAQIKLYWPEYKYPQMLPGQTEQETCYLASLNTKKCWSEYAELKTSRENGIGLGQFTIGYDKQGRETFNAFKEATKFKPLADWKFSDRYDYKRQITGIIFKDRQNFLAFAGAADEWQQTAFMLASYNGGLGGTLGEIRLCKATPGCDYRYWYQNVEYTSRKSRVAAQGYGASFFKTNRDYPVNIMYIRSEKYKPFFKAD